MADRTAIVLGTGAGVLGVDQLTPTVNWLLDGGHTARPESTGALIAASLILVLTAVYHAIQAAVQARAASVSPQPAQEGQ